MSDFYEAVNQLDPNNRNMAITVIEGKAFGEKGLLSDHKMIWRTEGSSFFQDFQQELEQLDDGGLYTVGVQRIFCELLGREKKLVICGGGHVSVALVRMGVMTGYEITVLEDRPEFAGQAREAGASRVICESFDSGLAQVSGDHDTFFVVATRGHRYDQICLAAIVRKPHAYIGMVGSRKRVAVVKEKLIADGADPDVVGGIYSPIGLDIGAETPEEIAVAILAEMISVRRKNRENDGYSRVLLQTILGESGNHKRNENSEENEEAIEEGRNKKNRKYGADERESKVLVTIVIRTGSAPRKEGTKMLILPDGSCVGTIGGGSVEAEVLKKGLRMLQNNEKAPRLFHVDMSGTTAEDEGMVCGGVIDVLLEVI